LYYVVFEFLEIFEICVIKPLFIIVMASLVYI